MVISVILEPNELGGYTAYLNSVPGCVTEGKTKAEALENFKEALLLHLETDPEELSENAMIEKIVI
jgi:predicted RNase H-like HicB family nuclease